MSQACLSLATATMRSRSFDALKYSVLASLISVRACSYTSVTAAADIPFW
jgi:hypothetical protein